MKKFKILYIFIFSSVFIACENDDFEPVKSSYTQTEEVQIGFSDNNNGAIVLEDGGQVSFDVFLSKALPSQGVVELEVVSSDGSIESNGVRELEYSETIIIPEGATTVPVELTFFDDTVSDGGETYTVKIKNFTTVETLTSFYIVSTADVTKKERNVQVYDVLPEIVETTVGDVQIELTWRDSSRDMDLGLFIGTEFDLNNLVDASTGVTTTEVVELPLAESDNLFSVYVDQYLFTAAVDYLITFTFPDGQELEYSGTINEDSFLFHFTKSTDGDNVTYLITEL
ncbi:hypothetical protein [Tenacibaculum sp. IB213877]|uniref:hypothetical protein n=1 Tax=Tenacibaculum sp. IB213877 TaxID=3097351 RepID=UPI002A5B0E7A|nr:hypothetical protein [Tenacibaculum sp. IB213877]MDY0781186.1 hypothetical protein [Tenacibaculum sp. IB213877]